jgi:probable rRNA maturation factor
MNSSKPDQDIIIRIAENYKGINFSSPKIKILVKTIINRFQSNKIRGSLSKARKLEISIAIVDDKTFRGLNKQFLNSNSTSDCLSFDLSDNTCESTKLFELVINGEMAVKQAKLRGHSGEAESALYITHGLLHHLGFNDSTEDKAKKMHNAEDEILQQLGYGLVYNKEISTGKKNKSPVNKEIG